MPVFGDGEVSYSEKRCYVRSKFAAEQLVIAADKSPDTGRHGIIRPGFAILGYGDFLIDPLLRMPSAPLMDSGWASSFIVGWDAAAAALLMEDALRKRPQDVRGSPFLVTGKDEPWAYGKLRHTAKKAAHPDLKLFPLPLLFMFLLSHVVEALLFVRFHILQGLFLLGVISKPSITPKWIGQLLMLQPSTFCNLAEFKLDDQRARKALGYRPQWGNLEGIMDIAEKIKQEKGVFDMRTAWVR